MLKMEVYLVKKLILKVINFKSKNLSFYNQSTKLKLNSKIKELEVGLR